MKDTGRTGAGGAADIGAVTEAGEIEGLNGGGGGVPRLGTFEGRCTGGGGGSGDPDTANGAEGSEGIEGAAIGAAGIAAIGAAGIAAIGAVGF